MRRCTVQEQKRQRQLSQISQSCQLSVDGLRAAASSTGTSRKYFSADTHYFQFCQGHAWNPLPGDDFLHFELFCCRVVQNCSAPICPCLHVGHPQTSCGSWLYLPVGPNDSPRKVPVGHQQVIVDTASSPADNHSTSQGD